jgi:hypothetical protein
MGWTFDDNTPEDFHLNKSSILTPTLGETFSMENHCCEFVHTLLRYFDLTCVINKLASVLNRKFPKIYFLN